MAAKTPAKGKASGGKPAAAAKTPAKGKSGKTPAKGKSGGK